MNSFRHWPLFAFIAAAATATLPTATARADPADALFKADRAFCAAAAAHGIKEAFLAFGAPDCTFLDTAPGRLQGSAAVEARFEGTPADLQLTWEPKFASLSGDLGYTWGTYASRRPDGKGGAVVRTGHYTTIWHRQPDGAWKYVLDTGVADPK